MSPELLERPAVPDVAAGLLSASSTAELLHRSGIEVDAAEPTYVRFEPPMGVLVGYRLSPRRGPDRETLELPGYIRGLEPERARTLADEWSRRRQADTPLGPGVRLLDDGRSVLFLFPNDARLRGLRRVVNMQKLKRILGELPELWTAGFRVRGRRSALAPIRYKPERRFLASADLSVIRAEESARHHVYLRLFPDARGARIGEVAEALREGGGAPLIPRQLGAVLDGRLFVEERVPGREILDAVVDGSADGAELATALRRLHAVDTAGILPERRPAELLSRLAQGLGTMAALEPDLIPAASALLNDLQGIVPDPSGATIHGDLNLHQVLLADHSPVFVDLARAAVGHPLQDAGELVAHLVDLSEERPEVRSRILAFREVFLHEFLGDRPQEDLPFFVAVALGNRALRRFRRVEEGWPKNSETLLVVARSALRVT